VLQTIPLLIGVSALTFVLLQLAPGDFLATMADNPQISPETLAAMRHGSGSTIRGGCSTCSISGTSSSISIS